MKPRGSVLIVVLGLLAILSVIGITFVTMSNLDRRTATNFAVQSQFMLAADGAVDYVCHHLAQDLWAYNTMDSPEEPDVSIERHAYYPYPGRLLSDHNKPTVLQTENVGLLRNEPFDYPDDKYDPWLSSPIDNAGSATGHLSYGYQTAGRSADFPFLYPVYGVGPYGLSDWGTDTDPDLRPNNLGFPKGDGSVPPYTASFGQGHGVWIPDLSFPFQTGLIRVSVTVLDHGGMVNVNAHGNPGDGGREGYYISDVDPSPVFDIPPEDGGITSEFIGPGGEAPGPWKSGTAPGNEAQKQVVIENPARYGDRPFSLAEELELRRLTGTYYTSRLEQLVPIQGFQRDPDFSSNAGASMRCNLTTVGWTAELRPNYNPEQGEEFDFIGNREGYDRRKVDLNLDHSEQIKGAIDELGIFSNDAHRNQFVANICAFRDGQEIAEEDAQAPPLLRNYGGKTEEHHRITEKGASRQPVFSEIEAEFTEQWEEDTDGDGAPDTTYRRWIITVEVFNPWRRLYLKAPREGLPLENMTVEIQLGNAVVENSSEDLQSANGEKWLLWKHSAEPLMWTIKQTINKVGELSVEDKKLSNAVEAINLQYHDSYGFSTEGNAITIDRIDSEYIDQAGRDEDGNPLAQGSPPHTIERGVVVEGGEDETDVLTVYIFQPEPLPGPEGESQHRWYEGAAPDTAPDDAVPIRFPRSVKLDLYEHTRPEDIQVGEQAMENIPQGGLPPEWLEGFSDNGTTDNTDDDAGFRAFPRLGDLNQILCPTEEEDFWPWVPRVAAKRGEEEKDIKFSWSSLTDADALAAANVFTPGGPWNDRIDNDGDGFADADLPDVNEFRGEDTGRDFSEQGDVDMGGRFGGSEIRVAGKINLNTASRKVLEALGQSFGINGLYQTVETLRNAGPIASPAEIINEQRLQGTGAPAPSCTEPADGWVEQQDLPYTLLSNIVTVRSDTFSIYGTVQYIDTQAMHEASKNNDIEGCKAAVRRSRRFWALVDRSPCLCQNPTPAGSMVVSDFIRPRILNFQWLD